MWKCCKLFTFYIFYFYFLGFDLIIIVIIITTPSSSITVWLFSRGSLGSWKLQYLPLNLLCNYRWVCGQYSPACLNMEDERQLCQGNSSNCVVSNSVLQRQYIDMVCYVTTVGCVGSIAPLVLIWKMSASFVKAILATVQ